MKGEVGRVKNSVPFRTELFEAQTGQGYRVLSWPLVFNKWDHFPERRGQPSTARTGGHVKAVDLWAQMTGVQKKPVSVISKQRPGFKITADERKCPGLQKDVLSSKEEKSVAQTEELVLHSGGGQGE
ncbi:hypothetical protein STEG23_015342 [Scotinomys teguina]